MSISKDAIKSDFRKVKYSGYDKTKLTKRLMDVIKSGNVRELEELIDVEKADMNVRYKNLFISESAHRGDLKILTSLIARGYDVNANNGRPLQFAVDNGCTKTINYLLNNGANIALLTISRQDILRDAVDKEDRRFDKRESQLPREAMQRKQQGLSSHNGKFIGR